MDPEYVEAAQNKLAVVILSAEMALARVGRNPSRELIERALRAAWAASEVLRASARRSASSARAASALRLLAPSPSRRRTTERRCRHSGAHSRSSSACPR